jgi:hypothetical protein
MFAKRNTKIGLHVMGNTWTKSQWREREGEGKRRRQHSVSSQCCEGEKETRRGNVVVHFLVCAQLRDWKKGWEWCNHNPTPFVPFACDLAKVKNIENRNGKRWRKWEGKVGKTRDQKNKMKGLLNPNLNHTNQCFFSHFLLQN